MAFKKTLQLYIGSFVSITLIHIGIRNYIYLPLPQHLKLITEENNLDSDFEIEE